MRLIEFTYALTAHHIAVTGMGGSLHTDKALTLRSHRVVRQAPHSMSK
jgi:hypothetical protein